MLAIRKMIREIRRLLAGERRRSPRHNAERVRVTNRVSDLELQVARMYGKTPEELFDYHRADRILGRREH